MAQNLELRQKISGTFNDTNSLVYVKSHVNQVDGLLDVNGKINIDLFHSSMLNTKRLVGTIVANTNFTSLMSDVESYNNNNTVMYPGSYFIANGAVTVSGVTGHYVMHGDDGGVGTYNDVHLENGDHLFYIKNDDVFVWDETLTEHTASTSIRYAQDYVELNNIIPDSLTDKGVVCNFDLEYLGATNPGGVDFTITGTIVNPNFDELAHYLHSQESQFWSDPMVNTIFSYNDGLGVTYYKVVVAANGDYNAGIQYYNTIQNTNAHVWGVINNTYNLASETSSGLMSAALFDKLSNIEFNANNYVHATNGANTTLTASGTQKIAAISVNELGHVTAVSLEDIAYASTTSEGVVEFADVSEVNEWKVTQASTLATSPALTKTMIDYFAGIKIYNNISTDLSTANSAHPDGALAFFAV